MSNGDKIYVCKICGVYLDNMLEGYCEECREEYRNIKHECGCGCGEMINRYHFKHKGALREVKYKNGHGRYKTDFIEVPKDLRKVYYLGIWMNKECACSVCGRVFTDKKSLHRHIDKRCKDERMDEFKYWWNKRYRCMCGCGSKTKPGRITLPGHSVEDPWNKGLTKHDDERLMEYSKRAFDRVEHDYKFKINMSGTSIERKMWALLDKLGIEYIPTYSFFYFYFADIAIPSQKKIIECDGDYWHSKERQIARDKEINDFVESKGWKLLRISEMQINACPITVEDKVREFLGLPEMVLK